MSDDDEEFYDRLFEAAVVPELWPEVLDRIAAMAGGVGTALMTIDPANFRWARSSSIRDLCVALVEGGWHHNNSRLDRLRMNRHAGFVRDIDVFGPGELEAERVFQEVLRPHGFGWAVGSLVEAPSNDSLVFSVERRFEDGPVPQEAVDRLNKIRPHLSRAALVSARLHLKRAQGMTESLSMIGLPAVVLHESGRVFSSNLMFEELGPQIITRSNDRIALADPRANEMLNDALQQLKAKHFIASPVSIAVPRYSDYAPFIVHLLPVRRSAHDIFGAALTILLVTPLASVKTVPEDVMNGLFDLSPAESRVANGLIAGRSVDDLATAFQVSPLTVRSHVKAILLKTGTSRQAELVALFAGVITPL